MEKKARPLHRWGERNIHCPIYNSCLDHAADRFWDCWDCSECAYRNTYENQRDWELTVDESMMFPTVPVSVLRTILRID